MCPQSSCDAQNVSSESSAATDEVRSHEVNHPESFCDRGRVLKRVVEGHGSPQHQSVFMRINGPDNGQVVRRPVARYRRSLVTDAGASGSAEAPIVLHNDQVFGVGEARREVIDLDSETRESPVVRALPEFLQRVGLTQGESSSRQKSVALEEPPSSKRICIGTEDPATRSDDPPAVASVVARSGRSGFVRASGGRPWARERKRHSPRHSPSASSTSLRRVRPIAVELPVETSRNQQIPRVRQDEMLARELQREFSSAAAYAANDANLSRALQEEENRRVFRPPAPVAIDDGRLPFLYLRQIERHRSLQAAVSQHHQHASSSRQAEVPRHRNRLLGGDSRRLRLVQERLAMLQSEVLQLAFVDRDFNENDYEMLLALDEGVKQRGAPQARIDELPVTEAEAADSTTEPCTICLEVPESGDHMRRLPCMHGFHQKCIDTWLQRRGNCPVCKATI